MKTSLQGIDLLLDREGKRNAVYLDSKGIPTVGVGHTGSDVHMGETWTDEEIEEVFAHDIGRFEDAVNGCVKVPLQQNQFDALVSFSFNCGTNALPGGDHGGPCSILRALNAGNYDGAANAFNNWKADPEDITRRNGEREQFRGTQFAARIEGD